jgi:hypothetical protein
MSSIKGGPQTMYFNSTDRKSAIPVRDCIRTAMCGISLHGSPHKNQCGSTAWSVSIRRSHGGGCGRHEREECTRTCLSTILVRGPVCDCLRTTVCGIVLCESPHKIQKGLFVWFASTDETSEGSWRQVRPTWRAKTY